MTNEELANIIFPNIKHDISYYEEIYPERNLKEGAVVTRFAPSPTGFVHMGSLLTTVVARKVPDDTDGVFFLRIEDTDGKRSVENGIEGILEDLKSFDITIDEGIIKENESIGNYGPYIQSERKEIYHTFIKHLIIEGYAYPCFCTEEDLTKMREQQEKIKDRIGYYGKYAICRNLTNDEIASKIKNNIPYVIRLKSNGDFNKKIELNDLVRGKIEFPENDLDIVLLKSDGLPTYHFAHVIDDHLMRTTHILRGEEWVSSYPIHYQLFRILNFKLPKFAHLGLLMKIDEDGTRRKLSKRKDPEAAVSYYSKMGIPVDAVKLYLMTIANSNFESWMDSNPDKKIKDFKFDFKKMSPSGSLFDLDKLINISKNYISKLTSEEVYNNTLSWAKIYDNQLVELLENDKDYAIKIFSIERYQKKPRKDYAMYSEIKNNIWYMYKDLFTINAYKDIKEYDKDILKEYVDKYYDVNDTQEEWYNKIKELASNNGYAKEVKEYKENPDNYKGHVGDICEQLRVAVTSLTMTPNLYEILKLLGTEEIKRRIELFNDFLTK